LPVPGAGVFLVVSFFFFLNRSSGLGGGGGAPAGRFTWLCLFLAVSFLFSVSLCFLKGLIFFINSPGGGGGGGGPEGVDCEKARDEKLTSTNITIHIKRDLSLAAYPKFFRIGAMLQIQLNLLIFF
jgi:hypothetical protein